MRRYVSTIITACLGATLALNAGCATETHAQAKQAAVERWTAARGAIMYSMAQQQFETGDLEKADRTCKQAIMVDPENPLFHELAGRIALERGELEQAYLKLGQAVSLNENRAESHYLLGVIYQRWQQYESALKEYELAYQCAPDEVANLLALGEMLVKLDRADEALTRLQGKLTYFEHSAALRVAIGQIHMMRGNPDEAIRSFSEARLLSPDDPTLIEQLAMAQFIAGDYPEAQFNLRRLLESKDAPERPDLQMALADCYLATDRPVDARALCLKVVQNQPNNVNAWIKLGQAAWIVGDDVRVREAASRAQGLAPDRHEGYLLQGMLAHKVGNNQQALELFDHASSLAPESALPWILKGMTLEQAGQADAAGRAYAQALRVAPGDKRAERLLAALDRQTR